MALTRTHRPMALSRPPAALLALAAVAVMVPLVAGRPQQTGYGSWGSFSGLGGSGSVAGSGSLGTNVGLGIHHSSAPGGTGGQYGLNVFGGKTASGSANGAVNLGVYQGGYRHPYNRGGFPGLGAPGFGGFGFMG